LKRLNLNLKIKLFNRVERLISARNLRPKKKEGFLKVISIFSFLGIMLGVMILIIVMSVMNGFRVDLTKKILGLNPHIIIEPSGSNIDKFFLKTLQDKYPNLKLSQSYSGEGIVMSKNTVKGVLVKAVSHKSENTRSFLKDIFKDKEQKIKKGTAVIGKEMAFDLDLTLGQQLNLTSSSFIITPLGAVPKQENFVIAGIFDSGFYEFDQNIIFLNTKDTLSLFEKDENDLNVEIYLDDALKADFYKKKIKEMNQNFYVYSWTDLNKSFFSALKVERNVMFVILTLIIVVAAFNIISGLTILIKNKTREIAILKTLGLSNKSIKKSFFLTGLTIGTLASTAGVILGVIFSIYIDSIKIFISNVFKIEIFPQDVYFLDKMPSEINLSSIVTIFIFSILITAIASYLPANSISKMNTTKALKYE